jgi:hypothetical protein
MVMGCRAAGNSNMVASLVVRFENNVLLSVRAEREEQGVMTRHSGHYVEEEQRSYSLSEPAIMIGYFRNEPPDRAPGGRRRWR